MALAKGKILAVDDTPANLEVIEETLSDAGYDVATAIDGERAIKRLTTYQPDLILLDIQMPGIDGFETCSRIKSNPKTAKIPIIFITAFTDLDNKVKGFSLGGVDYITKPFQALEMLARVETHVQLTQLNQNLEQAVASRTYELDLALKKLRNSQLQLVQSEKMSTLGNLVSGVAHEINNPVGFLKGNLKPAQRYIQDLLSLIDVYQAQYPQANEQVDGEIEAIDLDFVREDLPNLIDSMSLGIKRIQDISNSLRIFSRGDQDHKTEFNIHDGLDSTLLILKHRTKANENRPAIAIIKNYSGLAAIHCFPGQLNQVFMNVLANAIDACDEINQGKSFAEIESNPNCITIETQNLHNQQLQIHIQDNGCGMGSETVERLFEQGFTTKGVGQGTGLGMAIAHQIITEKHGGTIICTSELGQGTTFTITLPLAGL
ncbi:MAG: hybrid sensor histidine kinase/response regulator [Spirulina sp. SIO3F2]|nr:hybrid sensor histidine kinase/response regulator [Spirulina sp. SIO3F2]